MGHPGTTVIAAPSICIAIPAYEAARWVAGVVRGARRMAEHVVVVDDGSTDGTAEAAQDAGARVLRHPRNLGKGRALLTAFRDLFDRGFGGVVTMDADGQHLADDIPGLVQGVRAGADLVIGSRAHLFAGMHPLRRVSNRCSSFLISSLAGQLLPDVQCGFRIYSRRLIERTGFPEARFEAESAVVVRAVRLGLRVASVPIGLGFVDGRSTSHYRPVLDSLRIAGAVARARLESVGCQAERYS
jgi:glycosyltransferase involved in cell wall biosynthesis